MANLQVISLDTAVPQLRAPGTGDGYSFDSGSTNLGTWTTTALTTNEPVVQALGANLAGFTSTGYSLTGSNAQSLMSLSGTWNTSGTPTAMLLNITNTASNAASRLLDLQVGGSSVFNVTPSTSNPGLTVTNASAATLFSVSNTTIIGTRTVQLTPSANTSALTASSYSLSGSNAQSLVDLAGTWNTTGTPTAIKLNVTDTASNAASLFASFQFGGVSRFEFAKTAWRLYNTNDATTTNFERANIRWSSNILQIGTEKGGTGTARALELQTDGTTRATISATGEVNVAGALRIGTDAGKGLITYTTNTISFNPAGAAWFGIGNNIVDFSTWTVTGVTIGSTGNEAGISNRGGTPIVIRPRGGSGNGAGSYVSLFNSLPTVSGTTGHTQELTIQTWLPATGAAGIQFGGTTSSFPALKRNSAALNVRLADDSADANLTAAALTLSGNLTISTKDIVTDTTTGTKIGTGTTQKLAFWNATPVVQPVNSTAIDTLLVDTGLRASGGTANFATAIETSSTIKTGAPTGGTAAAWKLGAVASVSPTSPNRTIEVDIGGTIYYLHAKTTND